MIHDLTPHYADLTFLTALSEDHADRLVRFLAPGLTGTVADLGCGWAELLLRVVHAAPASNGIGVDLDEQRIAHGRQLAQSRGLSDRVTLTAGDAREVVPEQVAAVICIGASQIWGPPVEANQPLDYRAALTALRSLLPKGGRLVYGEAIWTQPPTEAATAVLAGRPDEFVTLPDLLDLTVAAGFRPVQVFQADLDEWDVFETGLTAKYARWLAEHDADHPDAAAVRELADGQQRAYFNGYRDILGLGYLCLLAS